MKKLRLMGMLLFSLGGSGINLADATVLSQCKIAWQDDWFVEHAVQPVQLLGWSQASGDTNGLFFYRSHEIMYFEFGNAGDDGVHSLIKQKLYFDNTVAPANISGIALDGDKLLVAFHGENGVGSWIKAFDWTKIRQELDEADDQSIFLDQKNEKEYLKKDYPNVGQAGDGIGRIYVTPSNHYHYLYGQYDSAGRKIGTWDQEGNFLGWVDGSNDIYRNQFLAVEANSTDQSHFYAYQQYDDKDTIMMICSFAQGCSNYGGADYAALTKASEYIPFTDNTGYTPYPRVLLASNRPTTDNDMRSLWEGNNKVLEFSLPTPPAMKNTTYTRVVGIAQEVNDLNPWSVYILKEFHDDSDASSARALVLYQCPYNHE